MADPIAESLLEYRKHFPALEDCCHFISHSLGCVPAKAKDDLAEFFELWRTKSITAWSDWLPEVDRSEEHTSELQSLRHLVCSILPEKKNKVTGQVIDL